ncbi:hypothetical protein [Acetivibrio clariflavus]|uniref:hypothetical protein n=1 Tax=Acetivibrio clariflavus TaxID=288965 RepID=UPI00211EA0C9|nr:hypothetical protein [Acetivibrio clariflavus]
MLGNDYSVFACREGVYFAVGLIRKDLVDYIGDIDKLLGKEEVKLISFEVDNDQASIYAIRTENRSNRFHLYEVKLTEVEKNRGS